MNRVKSILRRVVERPRMVLMISVLTFLLVGIVVFFLRGNNYLLSVLNLTFCLWSIIIYFFLIWRRDGYRLAVVWSLLYEVMLFIAFVLLMYDCWLIAFFVIPAFYLALRELDLERLNCRKNIMIITCMVLIIIAVVAIRLSVKDVFGTLVPFLVAILFLVIALQIKYFAHFNGVHFSFKKFVKPKTVRRVSVVIPNYNYARFLRERVNSIVKQNYPIYELIILDDASSDNSVDVINEIISDLRKEKPDLKLKFIPNSVNSGNVFKQWQKCFKESGGDYVWICEADDSCSKYFLNAVMRAFDDEEVVLSYAESCTIDENGKKQKNDLRDWIDMFNTGHWKKKYILDGKQELKSVLCVNNTIANVSSVVFKKQSCFYGFLNDAQNFTLAGDWFFYSKVLLRGKIAYHDESLNYHRMHTKGVTLTTDNHVHYREIITVQDEIASNVSLGSEVKRRISLRRKELMHSFGFSKEEMKYAKMNIQKLVRERKMSDKVLLSIIVCVFNGEEYIGDCLKSVLRDLPAFTEIIVVDDGSDDGTSRIVKEYSGHNKNLKYYYKKNGGLASAKNYGLKKSLGKYVIFMDSDDKISAGGYDVMLKCAVDKGADVVVCDMELVYDSGKNTYCSVYHYGLRDKLMGFLVDGLMASSNNKMVKKTLFDGLYYPEGKNNEDVAVTPVILARAKNIQYIPSAFYKYYQRSGSIQNSKFDIARLVIFDTCEQLFMNVKNIIPAKYEEIKGIVVSNQLIAMLVYIICDIRDSLERNAIIEGFSKKYRELEIGGNKYVKQYCEMIGMPKLSDMVLEEKPNKIYNYVRRCKNNETLNETIKMIFNIRGEKGRK